MFDFFIHQLLVWIEISKFWNRPNSSELVVEGQIIVYALGYFLLKKIVDSGVG
jgi:hypothetical protein